MLSCRWASSGLSTVAPAAKHPSGPVDRGEQTSWEIARRLCQRRATSATTSGDKSPDGVTSGRKPLTERVSRALPQAPLDSASGRSEMHRSRRRASTSEPCSDRASVPRSPPLGVDRGRCSPDLSPLRGEPARPSGRSPPLSRFRSTACDRSEERPQPVSRGAPGSRISRAWRRLRRAATASMRSLTSSDSAPPSTPLRRTGVACPAQPTRRSKGQRTECHRL